MKTLTAARIEHLLEELEWSDDNTRSIEGLDPNMQPLTDSIRRRNKAVRTALLAASLTDVAVDGGEVRKFVPILSSQGAE